jgi:uncharacterized membrane protein
MSARMTPAARGGNRISIAQASRNVPYALRLDRTSQLLGGALFLMPIVVLAFLLNKAFEFARRGLKPVAKLIPDQLVSVATMEAAMAIALIVILCFLAGLLARTVLPQNIMSRLESACYRTFPPMGI